MRRTITANWTDLVRAALDSQGLSQNKLAAEVGCSTATMSILLSGGQQSSKLLPGCEFYGGIGGVRHLSTVSPFRYVYRHGGRTDGSGRGVEAGRVQAAAQSCPGTTASGAFAKN